MTPAYNAALEAAGVDVADALARFMGSEALLEKYLRRFPEDPNYQALCQALGAGDAAGAFTAAHTLKGVCANLSLTRLLDPLSRQVECLRAGDLAGAAALAPETAAAYEDLRGLLRRWEG